MGVATQVGNSFGGALAVAMTIRHPQRVRRLVLMGAVGVSFPITEGLDAVWAYTPSIANMRKIMDYFAWDRSLVNDELARLRYEASIQPGFQEAFAALPHETLIVHGREDQVIPLATSLKFSQLIPRSQLHVYGRCGHWSQIGVRRSKDAGVTETSKVSRSGECELPTLCCRSNP